SSQRQCHPARSLPYPDQTSRVCAPAPRALGDPAMNREELFDKFLLRSLSRGEAEELKGLLRDDPTAGRALVEYINEASLMVRVGSQLQSVPAATAEIIDLRRAQQASAPAIRLRRPAAWTRVALGAGLVALPLLAWRLFPITSALHATVVTSNGEL